MTMTSNLADTVTRQMSPVFPPDKHLLGDLVFGGVFLATAAFLWRGNRRAALAAGALGGAALGAAALTDYSGQGRKPVDLATHKKIDLGLAAVAAGLPRLLLLRRRERRIFQAGALAITVLTNLTQFPEDNLRG